MVSNICRNACSFHQHQEDVIKTYAIGLGTGLLAAAAIALSPAVPALIPIGVQVVLIAFRTGLHVDNVANCLDLQPKTSKWSFALNETAEKDVQQTLSTVHKSAVSEFNSKSVHQINHCPRAHQSQIMRTSVLLVTVPSQ